MTRKETTIERIVREKTPNFCVSTDYFIDKFHSYKKWSCPVHFKNNCYVQKRGINNEVHFNRNFRMAMPDFVLMNDKQMSYLRRAIYRANKGLSYQNPFVRNNGWYIETFGEYWHSEEITGLSKEEHIIETKDIDYLPKYKQMYEGVEGEDYVVCTVCGEHKQNLKQHIRKCHGLSLEDYHGEIYCEKAKRAFHDCAVKKWKTQKKMI